MGITNNTIEQVKARADIVEVIGERVELRRAGSTFKACCPFHNEKTPSFTVNPAEGFFKCYGCGEGGDVFAFLQKYDRMEFPDAVKMLAGRYGVTVEEDGRPQTEAEKAAKNKKKEERKVAEAWLLRVHQVAQEHYSELLWHDEYGKEARDFLDLRGITEETARAWGLGYAPKRESKGLSLREALIKLAAEKKTEPLPVLHCATQAGLIGEKEGNGSAVFRYDKFVDRIVFPICDHDGKPIAFSGRALNWVKDESKYPKYYNSPEHDLFKKGKVLYGLDKARKKMRTAGRAILVEGHIDVIMMHQAGYSETVGTQGTAFTEDHARLLKRYSDTAIAMFDGDKAGRKAATESASVSIAADLQLSIATLDGNDDPADLISRNVIDPIDNAIDCSKPAFTHLINEHLPNMDDPAATARGIEKMNAIISQSSSAVQRKAMDKALCKASGMTGKDLREIRMTPAPPEGSAGAKTRAGNADDWLSMEVAEQFLSSLTPAPPDEFLGDEEPERSMAYHNDRHYLFNGQYYKRIADGDMAARIMAYMQDTDSGKPTTSFTNNVLANLKGYGRVDYAMDAPSWIRTGTPAGRTLCLANGLLDLDPFLDRKEKSPLRDHTPDFLNHCLLDFDYDFEADATNWHEFLAQIIPQQTDRDILQEWFGYCLIPTQAMERMMVMIGDGANGKSVVCDILRAMVGQRNCSSQPLETIHDSFNLHPLVGRLVNFSTELSRLSDGAEGVIKAIVGGDTLDVNRKNRDVLSGVAISARLVVTTNNMPRISDTSNGLWRRLIFLEFPVEIPIERRIPKNILLPRLTAELPGILNWALLGLRRLLDRGRFEETATGQRVKEAQRLEANPISSFADEYIEVTDQPTYSYSKTNLYDDYREWAEDNGLRAANKILFGREITQYIMRRLPGVSKDDISGRYRIGRERTTTYKYIKVDTFPAPPSPFDRDGGPDEIEF